MASLALVFTIDEARFALAADRVVAIAALERCTPVPALPAYVAGACTLRGRVVPVVDLCALWGIAHAGEYRCLITIGRGEGTVALLADAVWETARMDAPLASAAGEEPFGATVAAIFADKTTLLDADRLLDAVFQGAHE